MPYSSVVDFFPFPFPTLFIILLGSWHMKKGFSFVITLNKLVGHTQILGYLIQASLAPLGKLLIPTCHGKRIGLKLYEME